MIIPSNSGITFRLDKAKGGSSNTVLLSEKAVSVAGSSGGLEAGDQEGIFYGFKADSIRFADQQPTPDTANPTAATPTQFGSSHPAAFNIAFADGSVRQSLYSVSPAVWAAVCSRINQTPIDMSDFQ
jgi:prepilin-type processing-associated H-X9-DG protein